MNQLEFNAKKDEIVREILSQCDGPVTPFGAISRAINLASSNIFDNEIIANALYEQLTVLKANNDYLPSNEFSHSL